MAERQVAQRMGGRRERRDAARTSSLPPAALQRRRQRATHPRDRSHRSSDYGEAAHSRRGHRRRRQIGYSLLFRIASGAMFGTDQPVILQLLEIPVEKARRRPSRASRWSSTTAPSRCCKDIVLTGDAERRLQGRQLVPARRRQAPRPRHGARRPAEGQRQDLHRPGPDHRRRRRRRRPRRRRRQPLQHELHDRRHARPSACRADRFTAMVRLDQNRAPAPSSPRRPACDLTDVNDIFIYGNHSPTMFPTFAHATIDGKAGRHGHQRPGLAAGRRSARPSASAARRSSPPAASPRPPRPPTPWSTTSATSSTPGAIHSIAVNSEGRYGFADNVWAGMPVKHHDARQLRGHHQLRDGRLRQVEDQDHQRRTDRRTRHREGHAGLGPAFPPHRNGRRRAGVGGRFRLRGLSSPARRGSGR